MKRAKAIMWGVVLVLLGVILGINALDLFQMNIFFSRNRIKINIILKKHVDIILFKLHNKTVVIRLVCCLC